MSKTISPFLIILIMTHMMEFVSSAASIFVTWDVIWILMTSTIFSNLHMVREYIYMSIQTYEMAGFRYWWIMNVLGTLGFFFSCGSLPEGQTSICCPVYLTLEQNRGNPTKASGMLMIKIFIPMVSSATVPKILVCIYECKIKYKISASTHNTIVALYREYSRYRYLYFYHRETME